MKVSAKNTLLSREIQFSNTFDLYDLSLKSRYFFKTESFEKEAYFFAEIFIRFQQYLDLSMDKISD